MAQVFSHTHRLSGALQPMVMASMTWSAMYTIGAGTGIQIPITSMVLVTPVGQPLERTECTEVANRATMRVAAAPHTATLKYRVTLTKALVSALLAVQFHKVKGSEQSKFLAATNAEIAAISIYPLLKAKI